jgi:hypothetical protein
VAGNPILYYGSILVVAAVCAWLAITGVRTGETRFGLQRVKRVDGAVFFWFGILFLVVCAIAFLVVLIVVPPS